MLVTAIRKVNFMSAVLQLLAMALIVSIGSIASAQSGPSDPSGTWRWKYDLNGATREDALELFAEDGKVTGVFHGVSGKPIKIKSGKFGPYVTDGETNATIPAGEVPTEVSFDRAVELLADRRAKGPAKKPARRVRAKK
jgi:hypothetical protein